ncbi:glucose-6-phosphate isomerase [Aeromicrobium halocynthiae]|uniref:Glucose-6-phosphate isomerase n=1 Tax=Aeromicrobium halocynthiae TaxID=560557 RepID=A0ABN2VQ94_9ACTN
MVDVVLSGPAADAIADDLRTVVSDRVASRIFDHDADLWGPDARAEAQERLGWTSLAESSRPLLTPLGSLRDRLREDGVDHVVLCGMGGSSLAPEVICAAYGVELTVLDSSHPDTVHRALADRIERTVAVVSSKSGGTVETDSQRRAYEQAFTDAGIDPTDRIVVVTDPGSPLDELAGAAGYTVFHADPQVGGRYSALTAFGLVPSALAGVPVVELLDAAGAVEGALRSDDADNPALRLGTLLGASARDGIDKLVLDEDPAQAWGLGHWIEQLVAESTGKIGRGILPVVVPSAAAPNAVTATADSVRVSLGTLEPPQAGTDRAAAVAGELGAQFLLWEVATAVAGRLIGIDPFDQPDVESAKQAARDQLGGSAAAQAPDLQDQGIDVFGVGTGAQSLADALEQLVDALDPEHGYVAVQAYLDPRSDPQAARLRELLAERTGRPVTFGWGPRFLHSTGQYHKGGPATGLFLQLTSEPAQDLAIPGREFTFGEFIGSQAAGDAQVLRDKGRPVLRLHLHDVPSDLTRLAELLA